MTASAYIATMSKSRLWAAFFMAARRACATAHDGLEETGPAAAADLLSSLAAALPPQVLFPRPKPADSNRLKMIAILSSCTRDVRAELARSRPEGEPISAETLAGLKQTWTSDLHNIFQRKSRTDEKQAKRLAKLLSKNLGKLEQYCDSPDKKDFIREMGFAAQQRFEFMIDDYDLPGDGETDAQAQGSRLKNLDDGVTQINEHCKGADPKRIAMLNKEAIDHTALELVTPASVLRHETILFRVNEIDAAAAQIDKIVLEFDGRIPPADRLRKIQAPFAELQKTSLKMNEVLTFLENFPV
ncbi:MAG: hypothetical protein ABW032_11680 [Burkholderiaceae bacterium]